MKHVAFDLSIYLRTVGTGFVTDNNSFDCSIYLSFFMPKNLRFGNLNEHFGNIPGVVTVVFEVLPSFLLVVQEAQGSVVH